MDLFTQNTKKYAPLADRMRPNTISGFIGQEHLVFKNSFLYRAIISNQLGSSIFYGPPGTGKTTIANIIANSTSSHFRKLNAVSSGVADVKKIIDEAKNNLQLHGVKTYLLLDECHRWSKAQSDSVLQAIEQGWIIFIGSTTENPYTNLTRALVSRCKVFEFKPLTEKNIEEGINRAISDKENGYGNLKIKINADALKHISWFSLGDLRTAYNTIELAIATAPINENGEIVIDIETASQCMQKKQIGIDKTIYYDLLSAFGKSLRGSDSDAALYYSQRLLQAGIDPKIIARRLIAHASEDVGMADSMAVVMANTALNAVLNLGMPECDLVLSHAIIYVCEAPKSNSVYTAKALAQADAEQTANLLVPNNIKNHPTGFDDKTGSYKYPHNFGGYVKQEYLPKELKGKRYYKPSGNGAEKNMIVKKDKTDKS